MRDNVAGSVCAAGRQKCSNKITKHMDLVPKCLNRAQKSIHMPQKGTGGGGIFFASALDANCQLVCSSMSVTQAEKLYSFLSLDCWNCTKTVCLPNFPVQILKQNLAMDTSKEIGKWFVDSSNCRTLKVLPDEENFSLKGDRMISLGFLDCVFHLMLTVFRFGCCMFCFEP